MIQDVERFIARDERPDHTRRNLHVCCVIPTYKASATIVSVVSQALLYADTVIVVDDACPESSGAAVSDAFADNASVIVVCRKVNGGVGAATKTGIESALNLGTDVIVKLDADGQMDSSFVLTMRKAFSLDPSIVCIKGNRFFDSNVIALMPKIRLVGNAVLSLLAKCASGYWNAIDPTNGYLAFNAHVLRLMPWQNFADSYFFEISVLCELGLKRLPIVELEMPTIYTDAPSSLSIRRTVIEFPPRLLKATLRRLLVQYFIVDFNLASLYCLIGALLMLFGVVFGAYEWAQTLITHIPRPTGTIMLAMLPALMGFQLILNALMYDVQFSQRTSHQLRTSSIMIPMRSES